MVLTICLGAQMKENTCITVQDKNGPVLICTQQDCEIITFLLFEGQSDASPFSPCLHNKRAKLYFLIVYHLVDKGTHASIVFIKALVSVRDVKAQCLEANDAIGTFSPWI